MRVLFLGQTGLNKKHHLAQLMAHCSAQGKPIDATFHIGDLMYEEASKAGITVQQGKILDLPLAQLAVLRRSAFTRVSYESSRLQNVFVASHAVFRWKNQLFAAFQLPELGGFAPDLIITLIDDVDAIKGCLDRYKGDKLLPPDTNYSLKDLLVWREEEILTADILASILKVPHYILGVSLEPEVASYPLEVAFSLLFERWKRRAYVSYPISDAQGRPEVWRRVIQFRKLVRAHLAVFDPLMISEKRLQRVLALPTATGPHSQEAECQVGDQTVRLRRAEIEEAMADIDGQIVARDYKLVDQADMIVAYFPAGLDGSPLIAGGVQSELEHAAASTKQVAVVWESARDPTPFIGKKIDIKCSSLDELDTFLTEENEKSRPAEQLPLTRRV